MREGSRSGSESKVAYLLDTSALLLGFHVKENVFTTRYNVEEVKYGELQKTRLQAMMESGTLRILEPSRESLRAVKEASDKLKLRLSVADSALIAAALDLANESNSVTVVTDDYQVQRIAAWLQLTYTPLKLPGVRKGTK